MGTLTRCWMSVGLVQSRWRKLVYSISLKKSPETQTLISLKRLVQVSNASQQVSSSLNTKTSSLPQSHESNSLASKNNSFWSSTITQVASSTGTEEAFTTRIQEKSSTRTQVVSSTRIQEKSSTRTRDWSSSTGRGPLSGQRRGPLQGYMSPLPEQGTGHLPSHKRGVLQDTLVDVQPTKPRGGQRPQTTGHVTSASE